MAVRGVYGSQLLWLAANSARNGVFFRVSVHEGVMHGLATKNHGVSCREPPTLRSHGTWTRHGRNAGSATDGHFLRVLRHYTPFASAAVDLAAPIVEI